MKKNLLLVAALATAMYASAAEPVFGYMDVEALGFVKGDDGKWSEIENPKQVLSLLIMSVPLLNSLLMTPK